MITLFYFQPCEIAVFHIENLLTWQNEMSKWFLNTNNCLRPYHLVKRSWKNNSSYIMSKNLDCEHKSLRPTSISAQILKKIQLNHVRIPQWSLYNNVLLFQCCYFRIMGPRTLTLCSHLTLYPESTAPILEEGLL
jgi:hypothetical protein